MKIVIEASPQELLELGVSSDAEMRTKVLRSITQQAAHDVANPEPAGGQLAQDDYRKWYEDAMAACNEAGYAGIDVATVVRVLAHELRVAKQAQTPMRTNEEIVEQTEELAAKLMLWRWGQEAEGKDFEYRYSGNARAQGCWAAACKIQEMITGTDVQNAVAEVDELDPEHEQEDDAPQAEAQAQADVVEKQASAAVAAPEQVQEQAEPRVRMGIRRVASVRKPLEVEAAANTTTMRAKPEAAVSAAPAASAPAPTAPVTRAAGAGPVRRRVVGG